MRKIILPIIAFLTLACHASSKDKKLEKKGSKKNRDVAASTAVLLLTKKLSQQQCIVKIIGTVKHTNE